MNWGRIYFLVLNGQQSGQRAVEGKVSKESCKQGQGGFITLEKLSLGGERPTSCPREA